MKRVQLTDRSVAAAQAPVGRRRDFPDGRIPGLALRVAGADGKTWVLRYRTLDDQQMRLTLGKYPAVTLHHAREMAMEHLVNIAKGRDPATEKRQAKAKADLEVKTFRDLANLYEKVCASGEWSPRNKLKKESVRKEERRLLDRTILPKLGRYRFDSITRSEVKALLRELYEKGARTSVNRTHAVIRQIFNYAISEDMVQVNPATGFTKFVPERPRERIWKEGEMRALWVGMSNPTGLRMRDGSYADVSEAMCIAIKLTLLLGQRRNEVAGMEVNELDLEARTWRIRSGRMKGSRPHMVPLSDAAIVLIRRALAIAAEGRNTPPSFVFPTNRSEDRAIMPCSLSLGLQRTKKALGMVADATLHDMRRTVATHLTSERCGVSPFIRSKVLGHIDGGGGAMVSMLHYDVNDYLAEKRRALEIWTRVLLRIVGDTTLPDGRPGLRPMFVEGHVVADNDNATDLRSILSVVTPYQPNSL